MTGPVGQVQGVVVGTLTPGTSDVSLGSTGSAFLNIFMTGDLNLGSAQITAGAPESSRAAVTPRSCGSHVLSKAKVPFRLHKTAKIRSC